MPMLILTAMANAVLSLRNAEYRTAIANLRNVLQILSQSLISDHHQPPESSARHQQSDFSVVAVSVPFRPSSTSPAQQQDPGRIRNTGRASPPVTARISLHALYVDREVQDRVLLAPKQQRCVAAIALYNTGLAYQLMGGKGKSDQEKRFLSKAMKLYGKAILSFLATGRHADDDADLSDAEMLVLLFLFSNQVQMYLQLFQKPPRIRPQQSRQQKAHAPAG